MAYSDYLHCYDCEEKVLTWGNWDWMGCAHCVGDNERALEGVIAVLLGLHHGEGVGEATAD